MKQALLLLCLTVSLAPGAVKRVIDGDTFVLFHVGVPAEERVRLLGVDAPDRGHAGWTEARAFTQGWLAQGPAVLTTCRRDRFGRLVASVARAGEDLSAALVRAGLATAVTP